jgi:CheY-like chemotaxis protein
VRADAADNKILVVDDDPGIQKFLNRFLSNHGFIIETARDGFEAGSKVESFKPGLIILDLFMPGLDGFEVCRRIKQNPAKAGIRIVAITGNQGDAVRERILGLGADGFVPKPIDKNDLLAVINTLTEKSRH